MKRGDTHGEIGAMRTGCGWTSRASQAVATWGLVLMAWGCGGSLPPASDPMQARQVLTSALDAWKRGEKPGSLAMLVLDRDWEGGRSLIAYELTNEGEPLGLGIRCPVKLTMRDNSGKPWTKQVVYTVNTGADPVVARQDLDF